MATNSFPGLANIEAILRLIAGNLANINTTIAAVFPPALTSSITWNPPSVASGASTTTTVTVAGAVLGELAAASFSLDLQGLVLTAYVSAVNTVTAVLSNSTGGAVDLASGTLTARVYTH